MGNPLGKLRGSPQLLPGSLDLVAALLTRPEAARIFISYRSKGDMFAAVALDDRLSAAFGPQAVFRAARSIKPGEDYSEAIRAALAECAVMLVLVGEGWAGSFRRTPAPAGAPDIDWVELEIDTALRRGIAVIPVLLDGAERMSAADLPSRISTVASSQHLRLAGRTVDHDARRIVEVLKDNELAPVPPPRKMAAAPRRFPSFDAEVTSDSLLEIRLATRDADGLLVSQIAGRIDPADAGELARSLEAAEKYCDP